MVSYFFSPNYSGSAIQALNLSRYLVLRGAAPFIVSANLGRAKGEEICEGVPVFRLPVFRSRSFAIPSFWVSLAWFLFKHRNSYEIIHSHGNLQHGIVALVGKVLGKPTIMKIAMAQSDIAFHRHGRFWGPLNRFFVVRYARYIATSRQIEEEIGSQGLDRERTRRIPNGVDTAVFRPPLSEADKKALRGELGLPDAPIVVFVGIINSRKNIGFILKAFDEVVRRRPDASLVLVGPTPHHADSYWGELQHFLVERQLQDRVIFAGERKDVPGYLRAADVFVFPSFAEGMPNALLEAMSSGLPCVVSRASGTEDLIRHGFNGFIFDLADVKPYADAILRLLDEPAAAATVGARARETILANFSLDATADRYLSLYAELAERRLE